MKSNFKIASSYFIFFHQHMLNVCMWKGVYHHFSGYCPCINYFWSDPCDCLLLRFSITNLAFLFLADGMIGDHRGEAVPLVILAHVPQGILALHNVVNHLRIAAVIIHLLLGGVATQALLPSTATHLHQSSGSTQGMLLFP